MAPPTRKTLIAHRDPHADELGVYALLAAHGHRLRFETCGTDAEARAIKAADPDNVLLTGIGGGKFDEHAPEGKPDDMSAVGLAADWLELTVDSPWRTTVIPAIHRADTLPGDPHFGVGNLVKRLHEAATPLTWLKEFFRQACEAIVRRDSEEPAFLNPHLTVDFDPQLELPSTGGPIRKGTLRVIALPKRPGLQELVATVLFQRFPDRIFMCGTSEVEVLFIEEQSQIDDLNDRDDVLFIGFPGGQINFDTMSLQNLLKRLRLSREAMHSRDIKLTVKMIQNRDDAKFASDMDLFVIIEAMSQHSLCSSEYLLRVVRKIYDAYLEYAANFQERTPALVAGERSRYGDSFTHHGNKHGLEVFSAVTSLSPVPQWLEGRWHQREGAKSSGKDTSTPLVLIKRDPASIDASLRGTQIFLRHRGMDEAERSALMKHIARRVMQQEVKKAGRKDELPQDLAELTRRHDVSRNFMLPGAAAHWCWSYGNQLLNGSSTRDPEPPTTLSMAELVKAVRLGLRDWSNQQEAAAA